MAHKKGLGSSRNGRDSHSKRLGVKVFAGQTVTGGEIIVRQRGTRFKPGDGVGIGKDDTIYARAAGLRAAGLRAGFSPAAALPAASAAAASAGAPDSARPGLAAALAERERADASFTEVTSSLVSSWR